MTTAADAGSGKTHRDENFPVASRLIAPRHRAPILAFYGFVRAADDVADHPTLAAPDKLALIDRLEATLLGRDDAESAGVRLRAALAERGLSPRHAQDLLTAFRLDVTKRRYRDWEDLLGYCAYSAMPVGRFVLDVHGEDRGTWAANDALCAALQIINHLQDCNTDYLNLDRVYIPQDALAACGTTVEALNAPQATPALLQCLHGLAERTERLLGDSDDFAVMIADWRLGLEVSVINTLAHRLTQVLMRRDPLRDRVHLSAPAVAGNTLLAIFAGTSRRLGWQSTATSHKPRGV